MRTFRGHTEYLYSAVFSRDGRQVLTASFDQTAILWDATNGRKIRIFEGHTYDVTSAVFSPNGQGTSFPVLPVVEQ